MKIDGLRACFTFTFTCSLALFLIGAPTLEPSMHRQETLQENEVAPFGSLVASRRPRLKKEGALVNASGLNEKGDWRPLRRPRVWTHLHRRSQEAMA